jgi:hypothetical protein
VSGQQLPLYAKRLAKGESLRISGNAEQGQGVSSALNETSAKLF